MLQFSLTHIIDVYQEQYIALTQKCKNTVRLSVLNNSVSHGIYTIYGNGRLSG